MLLCVVLYTFIIILVMPMCEPPYMHMCGYRYMYMYMYILIVYYIHVYTQFVFVIHVYNYVIVCSSAFIMDIYTNVSHAYFMIVYACISDVTIIMTSHSHTIPVSTAIPFHCRFRLMSDR